MEPAPVSVVVVSHGRPALLRRCLIGIAQLTYPAFEVVVVADPDALAAIADLPFFGRLKTATQEKANISVARNAGVALAAGKIVAFLDDDAVPEPTWLSFLTDALKIGDAVAATGHVLGRNGISLQWGTRVVDVHGTARNLPPPTDTAPFVPELADDRALKLEGTNMAILRDVLVQIGGFDPAFRFYLDETDLAWRLHLAAYKVAAAPGALVHHGYAESARRRSNRAPKSLFEIGASTAAFLRSHAPRADLDPQLAALIRAQRQRLSRFLLQGDLEPRDHRRLMADLRKGIAAGRKRAVGVAVHFTAAPPPFSALQDAPPGPAQVLSGRWFSRRRLMEKAKALAQAGTPVSLFLLSPTIRAHRVRFVEPGIWVQEGGLFGPSERSQPRFRYWRFADRIAAEQDRIARARGLG